MRSRMIKVLIVDDSEVLIGLMKEMLETEGLYHVKTAKNGVEGYLTSIQFKPDVIITDIEMPVKNGLEMVRDIRVYQPDIKTIYMSADLSRYRTLLEDEISKYKATLLNKPFSLSEVIGLFCECKGEERL